MKQTHIENKFVFANGEVGGEEWNGSLGLADARYYL